MFLFLWKGWLGGSLVNTLVSLPLQFEPRTQQNVGKFLGVHRYLAVYNAESLPTSMHLFPLSLNKTTHRDMIYTVYWKWH